jgi:SPP1 family predicted phage head-tail adaptor
MKPQRIGPLRNLVDVQEPVETTNDVGEPVETWAAITGGDDVWASIEPISGREFQVLQQIAAETTHKVILRYISGVTPKMRVLFGSRTLDILAVRNLEERGRYLELLCRERV